MRILDLLGPALPMAEMKSVTVPGTTGIALSPEVLSVLLFAGLAALAIYVFLR
jgi:hypothetical protein